MSVEHTSTRPYSPVLAQTSTRTSNQDLVPVNLPQGQLLLERNPNQDLFLVNQALGQLSIEGLRNQEMIIGNVTSLFTGLQALQEVVQSQASELLLVKEQLKIAEEQKKETAKIFEAYKNATNESMEVLLKKIQKYEEQILEFQPVSRRIADLETRLSRRIADLETRLSRRIADLETRFHTHTHAHWGDRYPYGNTYPTTVPNNAVDPKNL